MTLSHPALRSTITDAYLEYLETQEYDCIAGVATGGIAYAALIADRLQLPMIYVRSKAKGHGRQNMIEGDIKPGYRCAVIEDLVSTGGSSMKAIQALRTAEMSVSACVSIFNYGFQQAEDLFSEENCPLHSLVLYADLMSKAQELDFINQEGKKQLEQWRQSPSTWRQS